MVLPLVGFNGALWARAADRGRYQEVRTRTAPAFNLSTYDYGVAKPPRRSSEEAQFRKPDRSCFRAPRYPQRSGLHNPSRPTANQKPGTPPIFALQIEIVESRDAKAGEHSLRLVTPNGLSNQLGLRADAGTRCARAKRGRFFEQVSCNHQRAARQTRRKRRVLGRSCRAAKR